jgi:DNA invertase Pin-like site-specific DNA recombinase
MGERAARWFRVSSSSQDEQNQFSDVDRHCAGRGYEVVKTFRLHAVSASKGEQEPELAEVLADIRAGLYTVLVVAQSSRLDRRDDLDAQQLFAISVRMAGGRVESVDEPDFGKGDLAGRVVTLLAQEGNAKYSRDLKANIRRGKDRVRANGALINRYPWGFTSAGPKYSRRAVPTDQAREYVPQVYARIIAGQSLATVCRWLDAEGVAPAGIASAASERGKTGKWWPRTLGVLIRNPAYKGLLTDGHGQTTTTCEALVDAHTWAQAGKRLDDAPKRGPVARENRCALSGASRCWSCGGPLYRIWCGTGTSRAAYLRCSGTGPDRHGCGAPMIRLDTAEALADEVLGGLGMPVLEFREVPGNEAEIAARLAALDYERRQVALRGLPWDEEDAERARIRAAYDLAAATPVVPSRRAARPAGVSYGQRWNKLDAHGRAAWLRSGEVTVLFTKGAVEHPDWPGTYHRDGVTMVLAWAELDDDEG